MSGFAGPSGSNGTPVDAQVLALFAGGAVAPPTAHTLVGKLERPEGGDLGAAIVEVCETVRTYAVAAPTAAAIFLYDILRTLAESQRPGRTPLPENDRLALIGVLGSQDNPVSLLGAFAGEAERLLSNHGAAVSTQHPLAQRAQRFIEAHAGEKLSLARVSREIGVTRTYLSALFRRECGVTLTEYIHRVRIERAENYLRGGGLTMAEIAELSGYGSYRHFHRSFLKLRHVSPRVFVKGLAPAGRRGRAALRQAAD